MASENEMNSKQSNIILSSQEILQKDFKKQMRGYDQNEVDEFLDDVIKDYETFNSEIDHLKNENERLLTKVDELTRRLNASTNGQNMVSQNNAATNYDILKRLSNLERHVFGAKLNTDNSSTLNSNNIDYRNIKTNASVNIPKRPVSRDSSINLNDSVQDDFDQSVNRF